MAYGPWKGQRWRTVWNNGYYRIDVKWDFCQDIENNKTMIAMCGQRVASLNGYYSFNYTACETGVGDFNGTKFPETRAVSVGGGGTTEIECTHRHSEVTHNADGTWPSGQVCGWWRFNVPLASHNVPTVGWTAFNIDGEIPTIPRATTPTLSAASVACGSNLTINLPRHASGFTHRISYRIGGKDKGTITTNAGTSFVWTVQNLGSYMPNSTSVWVVLRVETMSGSTVIGYKDIGFTATALTSWVPTATISSIAEATANLATQFGGYVQGKSTLRVKSAGSGSNGSTISSYVVTIQGRKYNGADITSAAISASGTVAVTLTVTDSRGRKASKTQNVSVLAYSPPQITVSSVARTSDEATTAVCTYNFSIASVNNKNTKAFYIQYLNGSTWTDITRMSDVYTKSGSVTSGAIFGVDATTKVRFVAQDYFTSVIVEKEVGPTFTLMNLGAGGKSLAIGMLSSNNGTFETGLPFVSGGVRYTAKKFIAVTNTPQWLKVCTLKNSSDSDSAFVHVYTGDGWNARANQQTEVEIFVKDSFQSSHSTTDAFGGSYNVVGTYHAGIHVRVIALSASSCEIWLYLPWAYSSGFFTIESQCEVEVEGKCQTDAPTGANQTMGNLTPDNRGYPIGSVKITYDNVNPSTNMGGTWVQFGQGRVLIGQGTGSDGTTSKTFGAGATGGRYTSDQINTTNSALSGFPSNGANYADRCIVRKQAAGYNQERDAMISLVQPYQVIYAWRRTA
ncbi:DUF859 family phage minor structural protein [Faecalibaculum rodentium]|uniref:Baseplate structural protein Gp10 C-terminal domain-containing protein n=1 Tax=Faecalibaculum rodentium TaxID=1702221 RepID=A0A140DVE3_9FIRM|nr:DUF859 family phage minor structural protein [Faecalibaculum rodentium]AMK54620.1 hypothetical protein AALO17_14860 [Faecalibaculum rodentium]